MDFKIKTAMERHDPDTPEGKADILTELGPSLLSLKNMVERSEYIHEISEKLSISEELLKNDIRRKTAEGRSDFGRDTGLFETKAARGITMAKNSVLYFAAENKEVFEEIEGATQWNFLDSAAQKAVVRTIRRRGNEYSWKFRDLVELAEEEDQNMIYSYIMDDPFALVDDKNRMFRDCWRLIRKDALMKKKESSQNRIKECEKSGNTGELDILLRNFAEIQQELRKI